MPSNRFDISVVLRVLDRASAPFAGVARRVDKLTHSMSSAIRRAGGLGRAMQNVGRGMRSIGNAMALRITAPITAFGALALRSATNFQRAMNMVGAVTKTAGTAQFERLEKVALRLGATTMFTATQAAEGMKFLGQAGKSTEDIIATMPKVLELAASAQLDMGTAASILVNVMGGYQRKATELSDVNDTLVAGFTKAKLDLTSLGRGFSIVGGTAKEMGIPLQQTAAALGMLANVGRESSVGATGLRTALAKLAVPSGPLKKVIDYFRVDLRQANGKLKDFIQLAAEFEKKGVGLEALTFGLGVRAGPVLWDLMKQGTDAIKLQTDRMTDHGIAARIFQEQMRGLPGVMARLASAYEAFQIHIVQRGGIGAAFTKIAGAITNFLSDLSEAETKTLAWITVILTIAAVTPVVLASVGAVVAGIGALAIAIGGPTTAILALSIAMAGIGTYVATQWEPANVAFKDSWQILKNINALLNPFVPFSEMRETRTGQAIQDFFTDHERYRVLPLAERRERQAVFARAGALDVQSIGGGGEIVLRVTSDEGLTTTVQQIRGFEKGEPPTIKTGYSGLDHMGPFPDYTYGD